MASASSRCHTGVRNDCSRQGDDGGVKFTATFFGEASRNEPFSSENHDYVGWHARCKGRCMTTSEAGGSCDTPAPLLVLATVPSACGIADGCREAVHSFIGEAESWSKGDLTNWLVGVYARLTYDTETDGLVSAEPVRCDALLDDLEGLDVQTLQRVIWHAHTEVVETLESLESLSGVAEFTLSMFSIGFVSPFADASHGVGWVPTTRARRLADRVLSLVAAEFLTRPEEYAVVPHASVTSRASTMPESPTQLADDLPDMYVERPRFATMPYLREEA